MFHLINDRDADGKLLKHEIVDGLFQSQYRVPRKEQLHTSVLTATLAEWFPQIGGLKAHWLHQVPDRTAAIVDVCLYVEREPMVWVPVCLWEFGVHGKACNKHVQTMAYCVNVCPQLQPGHLLLAVEAILSPSDGDGELAWLRVSAVCIVEAFCMGAVLLWEGPLNALSVSQLLAAADMIAQERYPHADTWHSSKNAAIGDDHVWKAYDYRDCAVQLDDRRSPDLSCKYIPGCKIVCKSTDLVLIRYPYLEGTHQPRSVGQWIAVLRCVLRLHQDGIVHGDLRLSNIVFSSTSDVVTIIDYDFSGRHREKTYPLHFNCNIDDGARHRSASAGRLLLFPHDWFAVAAMMKLCQLEQAEPRWQQAQKLLEEPGMVVAEVIQLLENCSSLLLVLQNKKASSALAVEGGPGTGSPEKK